MSEKDQVIKKIVKDSAETSGKILGNAMSQNAQNATNAAVEGMNLFRWKVSTPIIQNGVFDAQNIEIGLEDAVLTRIAVHNNEGKVETDNLPIVFKGEVVAVHRASLVSVHPKPTLTLNDDFVYIIFSVVQLTVHLVSTGNRDIMLATETTHNKCYILFHLCNGICC